MYFPIRFPFAFVLLTATLSHAAFAQEATFDSGQLSREGFSLDDFIPRGWKAEGKAQGDLNADGIDDIAAILVPPPAGSTLQEGPRVLLALLGGGGKFRLAGHNAGFLVCMHCGGVKESAGVGIQKGVLIVNQLSGSREFTDQTWRFRYDPKTRRFVLIGKDQTDGDSLRGKGEKASFNFLTGFKTSESYRYDPKRNREITLASKKEKIPKQTLFLENVGIE